MRSLYELPEAVGREITSIVMCILASPPQSRERELLQEAYVLLCLRHHVTEPECKFAYLMIRDRALGDLGRKEKLALANFMASSICNIN